MNKKLIFGIIAGLLIFYLFFSYILGILPMVYFCHGVMTPAGVDDHCHWFEMDHVH